MTTVIVAFDSLELRLEQILKFEWFNQLSMLLPFELEAEDGAAAF